MTFGAMEADKKMANNLSTEPQFEGVWPLGRLTSKAMETGPRLSELDAAKIGFVWDYLYRGDEIFDILHSALARDYPGMRFGDYQDFGNIHGPEERRVVNELPDRLRSSGVDGLVVGVGA
jgi:hypothetical protein